MSRSTCEGLSLIIWHAPDPNLGELGTPVSQPRERFHHLRQRQSGETITGASELREVFLFYRARDSKVFSILLHSVNNSLISPE
ncbi:hypothetical protein R1flu_019460 [Riccia fluitans]|uniref:Uncharacterized protein n=1 Tax=Riccia fluitans TaxID=41844 RepID=A0ABD1ZIP7_9MARC